MGKRANIRATAINTRAIAESNAEMARLARRDQLVAQGLIDFNATDGVVRAVERRLATQRGEHVAPIGDPTGSNNVAAAGMVLFVIGIGVAFVSGAAGFWIIVLGVILAAAGCSNAQKIEQLRSDDAELAALEAGHTV